MSWTSQSTSAPLTKTYHKDNESECCSHGHIPVLREPDLHVVQAFRREEHRLQVGEWTGGIHLEEKRSGTSAGIGRAHRRRPLDVWLNIIWKGRSFALWEADKGTERGISAKVTERILDAPEQQQNTPYSRTAVPTLWTEYLWLVVPTWMCTWQVKMCQTIF